MPVFKYSGDKFSVNFSHPSTAKAFQVASKDPEISITVERGGNYSEEARGLQVEVILPDVLVKFDTPSLDSEELLLRVRMAKAALDAYRRFKKELSDAENAKEK